MKRGFVRLAVLACVLGGFFLPVRTQAIATIQPGVAIQSGDAGCTLGFGATGGGKTYFLTAAHCVEAIGDDVAVEGAEVFGDVVAIGDADTTEGDWSLIEVRAEMVPFTSGAVIGIDEAPKGVIKATQTKTGDILHFSGYGIPWFLNDTLREKRVGVIVNDNAEMYRAVGLDTNGDSGGPIVHQTSKKAYGLVSRLCFGPCTSEGPTVEGIFAKAAAKGFALTLRKT